MSFRSLVYKETSDQHILRQRIRELKDVIAEEKRDYFTTKVLNCKTSKALFDVASEMKGKTNSSPLPNEIYDLPNAFGAYFEEKIEKLRAGLQNDCDIDIVRESQQDIQFSGNALNEFRKVTLSEVKQIIMSSDPKSCSLDPIPTRILIECLDVLIEPITNLINDSLESGLVPISHKKAIITPLLKKHNLDPNNLKNYRPVSNLSFISKILEKVVLQQLQNHLQKYDLVERLQSAYRQNHSTESALLKIVNDMLLSADSGKASLLTLLDLSAAFDTIDHRILCDRLSKLFGITDTALSWFKSYLSDRSQRVTIGNQSSNEIKLKYGVPQGSVLGPTLYILYTI